MSLQKFIRASTAQSALALPKSSFYAHIEEGLLPPPIRLGKRSVGWLESEINAVIRARIQNQSDDEIKALVQQQIRKRREQYSE